MCSLLCCKVTLVPFHPPLSGTLHVPLICGPCCFCSQAEHDPPLLMSPKELDLMLPLVQQQDVDQKLLTFLRELKPQIRVPRNQGLKVWGSSGRVCGRSTLNGVGTGGAGRARSEH